MNKEFIRSKIWFEVAENDDPFTAKQCFCSGYNVYDDMLGKASWFEYLYLLMKGERPLEFQTKILEGLAIAIANSGPRDYAVRGAMNASVGGSTSAACLISAIGIGAGRMGGAREVYDAVQAWNYCSNNIDTWSEYFSKTCNSTQNDIWLSNEHPPGFNPYGKSCALPVTQTLEYLANLSEGNALPWLNRNRIGLESIVSMPLSMCGVAAACFVDLGFDESESEILFLLLRLPGALAHSLEQRRFGWRNYPFFSEAMNLQNDPLKNQLDNGDAYSRELELNE